MPTFVAALLWNAGVATLLCVAVHLLSGWKLLRERPSLVHTLWLLVLARFITPPLIPLPVLPGARQETSVERTQAATTATTDTRVLPPTVSPISRTPGAISVRRQLTVDEPRQRPRSNIPWLAIVAVASSCGTVLLLGASVWQHERTQRLLRFATSGDERLKGLAQTAAHRMGMDRSPVVYIANASIVPFLVVRWSGPAIVLPVDLVKRMSDEQVTCILCHELAHYVRRDHWSNALALIVTALFWWHPAAWWAWREMRSAQELCCDGLALAAGATSRHCYAVTLFEVLEFVQTKGSTSPTLLCGFGNKSSLIRRFEMIATLRNHRRSSWGAALFVVACIAAMVCVPVRVQSQTGGAQAATETPSVTETPSTKEGAAPNAAPELPVAASMGVEMVAFGSDSKDYRLVEAEADRLVALLEAFGHDKIYIWAYDRQKGTTSITASPADHQLMSSLIELLAKERRVAEKDPNQPENLVWEKLGLSLDPLEASQVQRVRSQLRGGLIVIAVRDNSPANQASVLEGDVIVGLGNWETLSRENVDWVLQHADEVKNGEPLRIFLLRNGELRHAAVRLGPQ